MTEAPDSGDPALAERAVAVRFFRALRDWTQEELSAASGVDRTLISRYETGAKRPSLRTLGRLAAGAGFPAARLEELLVFLRSTAAPDSRRSPYREPPRSAEAISQAVAAALRPPLGEALRGLSHTEPSDIPRVSDRAEAPRRLARLLGFDQDRRRRLVELSEAYRSWAVAELAGEESARAAASDPEEALELARFALFIAERVPGSAAWSERLQGLEWGFVANAQRVANNHDGAAADFMTAWRLWEAGAPGDPGLLDPSRLPDLEASLLRAQRQFPRALALLDRALATSPSPRRTASILLKKAFTQEQAGDVEAATAALAAAAPLLAGTNEPRLVWVHRLNLGVNLCHMSRFEEAIPLAAEAREIAVSLGNDVDLRRVRWLEARIAAGLDRRGEAIATMREVRREFADQAMPYDAALATLDLAVLLLEAGENAEVRELAAEMVAIFESLKVHREALAAVELFCRAVEQETATAELGRQVIRFLERARHDPGLRFEPGPPALSLR